MIGIGIGIGIGIIKARKRQATIEKTISGEFFPLDLAENEPAVIAHKVDNRVKLLVYKPTFITHNGNSDNTSGAVVLLLNFGN